MTFTKTLMSTCLSLAMMGPAGASRNLIPDNSLQADQQPKPTKLMLARWAENNKTIDSPPVIFFARHHHAAARYDGPSELELLREDLQVSRDFLKKVFKRLQE